MPAIASLEELKGVEEELKKLKESFPQAYEEFSQLFRRNRKVGYKNICKMLLGEATPEKLKGMD
ncbi:MAG: hypothetical protein DRP87_16360 [Spirochaetes bacterium]|nr:MAG: hypothetical protein DRP87_16360 [Spirochaetota bacterium]